MILSTEDTFDWKAAITVTRNSINTIDLKQAGRDIGNADGLWLFGLVTADFTTATTSNLSCALVQSTAENLGSPDTLLPLFGATAHTVFVTGYEMFKLRLPVGKITKRYIGLVWTASATMTGGAVSAGLTPNVDAWKAYPRGYVNS